MSIQSYATNAFTNEHEQLLATIASQAARAIENAQLFFQLEQELEERRLAEQKIQGQLQRLTALRTIQMAISSSFDIRMTLEILLEQVVSLLQVDAADILLFNPHTLMLDYAVIRGFRSIEIRHASIKPGDELAGLAIQKLSPVYIADLSQNDYRLTRSYLVNNEKFVAYHGLPLIAKGEVKGVLEIFHRSALEGDIEWLDFLRISGMYYY
jgi:GAF domain-containing protein